MAMTTEYGVQALDYLQRVQCLLQRGGTANLLYAAFELRCALEAAGFDLADLATQGDRARLLAKPKAYKPKDMFALLDTEEWMGLYFSALIMQSIGRLPPGQNPFDREFIVKAHDDCNKYLHHQKDPAKTVDSQRWIEVLTDFLQVSCSQLLSMLRHMHAYPEELGPTGEAMWEYYKSGTHTDDEIVGMLKISEGVLGG